MTEVPIVARGKGGKLRRNLLLVGKSLVLAPGGGRGERPLGFEIARSLVAKKKGGKGSADFSLVLGTDA